MHVAGGVDADNVADDELRRDLAMVKLPTWRLGRPAVSARHVAMWHMHLYALAKFFFVFFATYISEPRQACLGVKCKNKGGSQEMS